MGNKDQQVSQEEAIHDDPSEYSLWKEIALMISILTNFTNLVGFVGTAWATPVDRDFDSDFEGLGLWRFCSYNIAPTATCIKTSSIDMPGWFIATQGLMCAGFTVSTFALIILILSECFKRCRTNLIVLNLAILLTFAGSFTSTAGVIVFATGLKSGEALDLPGEPAGVTYDTDWAFTTSTAAAGISDLVGVFLIIELIRSKHRGRKGNKTTPAQRSTHAEQSVV